jgi:hypothetical protein
LRYPKLTQNNVHTTFRFDENAQLDNRNIIR